VRLLTCIVLAVIGCSKDPGTPGRPDTTGRGAGGACLTNADCPPTQWCLHQRCSDRADPPEPAGGSDDHLAATPGTLNFGMVVVGDSRTLALVVENDGASVVTIQEVTVDQDDAPFSIESMGYGPFWIRPGRVREIFVTFTPTGTASQTATLTIHSPAPAVTVNLIGN